MRLCDVQGLTLGIEGDAPAIWERMAPFLPCAASDPSLHEPFTVYLTPRLEAPSLLAGQDLREYWRGELFDGTPLVCSVSPQAIRLDLPAIARLEVDHAARQARIAVAPGQEWCVLAHCLTPLLVELLGRRGHHVVHAAALADDLHGQRRAVLISGVSGRGKTTTALALAGEGFQVLSDDTTFLTDADGQVQAWGLPLPWKVHHQTYALLPWLRELPSRPARRRDESSIDVAGTPLALPYRQVRAHAVLFLDSRQSTHRLEPLSKVAAIARLAQENVRATDGCRTGPAGQTFQMLSRLIAQCPTYCLHAGPDLTSLAPLVRDLLWKGDDAQPH